MIKRMNDSKKRKTEPKIIKPKHKIVYMTLINIFTDNG